MWWQTSLLCRRHLSGDLQPKVIWRPGSRCRWSVTFSLQLCLHLMQCCSNAAPTGIIVWFFFFQALQSQSRQRRWTNNNVFNASEVTNVYCRQRSKVEIKKSFNKERITFLSTFPGKNSNGRTLRNALPNMVEHYLHFIVIAVKAEWRMF